MEKLFKRKVVFILLSLAIALSTAFCLFGVHTAKAEEKQNGTVAISHVIPESNMEVYDLSSPIDAYYWQGGIAIVQSGSLVICTNDVYHQPIALTSPKQVKRLDNNTLIVSRNGALCSIDLNNPDATPVELKTVSDTTVGGNDFDCNEDYIVSEYANDINIYTITPDGISEPTTWNNQKTSDTSICMNDKNEIFYVKEGKLWKSPVENKANAIELSEDSPTTMIARGDFVYYVNGSSIIKINTVTRTKNEFVLDGNPDYDLGNMGDPEGISFKGENLLISDSSKNAVQEFRLNEETSKLEFTGFAIAKNKTAFNRVGNNTKDIDAYADSVAILDGYKLTVVTNDGNQKTYKNYLQSQLGNVEKISFGNDKIIAYTNAPSKIVTVDLTKTEDAISSVSVSERIADITYRFGDFYLLTLTPGYQQTTAKVYKFDGASLDQVQPEIQYLYNNGATSDPVFTVSNDGAINLYDPYSKKTVSFVKIDGTYTSAEYNGFIPYNLDKLESDFSGNLFGLSNSAIVYTDGQDLFTTTLSYDENTVTDVTSFCMDENSKKVLFTIDGEEGYFMTEELPNFSVDKLYTADYKVSDKTADINNLKIYTTDNEWIYSVSAYKQDSLYGFKVNAEELSEGGEYAFICDATKTVSLGDYSSTKTYSILVGQNYANKNAVFMVAKEDLIDVTLISPSTLSKAYVFTDVNGYFLPIISINNYFCLYDLDTTVRIKKGSEIFAPDGYGTLPKITFLDKEFYYASVIIEGQSYTGYVPVNFTVDVLDEDVVTKSYTLETVNKTVVKNANGNEICTLQKGSTVRLYSVKDGVCTIEYFDGENWRQGYVNETAIVVAKNTTIRNAVLIILMTASVIATTCYFILRKKKNKN